MNEKIKQTWFAKGFINAKTALTNPPKLITVKNGKIEIFAKIEYKLKELK